MKKLLLTLVLVLGTVVVFSQALSSPPVYRIANATTAFGVNTPATAFIFDDGTDILHIITAPALNTATLTTATKVTVDMSATNEFQNLTWDGVNGHIEISDGNDADIGMFSTVGTTYGFVPGSNGGTTNFLRGDGTWATPPGGGNVSNTGTPLNDQVPIWTNSTTIEGDADLTFNGTKLTATQLYITTPTAGVADYDKFLVLDVTGTEVKYRTGAEVATDIGALTSEVDGSISNEGSLSVTAGIATSSVIHSNTSGSTDVTVNVAGILTISETASSMTITGTEVDGSISNEGSLTVAAGGANTSEIASNTSGSTNVVISGGTNITVTEAGSTITIASTAGSGTVTSVSAGAGMDFTTITATGSVIMGTPSTLTSATTNSASGTTHTHAITTGIASTNIVKVSAADVANGEYARFTTTGLESRTAAEVATDLNVEHYKVEHFAESTTGNDGDTHVLGQTPDNSSAILVQLNGHPLNTNQYTYTPATPSIEVTIPVYQYDRVCVAYGY